MDLIYGIVSFITGTRYCVSSHCRAALPDSTACERCALCCKQHHRSPVFVPPCSDHQNFCIVSNCITPAQLTCRSRCCASHCNVAWCAAHGDPTLCHQCSCRSLTAGCRFCSCPLCCKKVAFARCSAAAHQGLCSSPLCEQSAANSICSLCDTCCKTAWCASHGNPSLCRRCIVADFMTECTAFLCAACGNRTDATRCKCPTHKRLCAKAGCTSDASAGCDAERCRQCCTTAWCASHGDPSLCRRCCVDKAVKKCAHSFCDHCCKKRDDDSCPLHERECRKCRNRYAQRCDAHCCGACCSLLWCVVHGDPKLCHGCAPRARLTQRCSMFMCKGCCTYARCVAHKLCVACESVPRATGCTTSKCGSCCVDAKCGHARCRSCSSLKHRGCRNGQCDSCCNGCDVHVRRCMCRKRIDVERDSDCVGRLCADCCKQMPTRDCPWHRDKWFGNFRCKCGNTWASGYAYRGLTQQCRRCSKSCYPSQVRPHLHNTTVDNRLPHDSERCERCRRFGSCRSQQPPQQRASLQPADNYRAHHDYDYYDYD
jgi:hypothetical protein